MEYPLSEQPVFGNWTIKVVAQGQEESKSFLVEEYCKYSSVPLLMSPFHLPLFFTTITLTSVRVDLHESCGKREK